jgi:hypothetical protein
VLDKYSIDPGSTYTTLSLGLVLLLDVKANKKARKMTKTPKYLRIGVFFEVDILFMIILNE